MNKLRNNFKVTTIKLIDTFIYNNLTRLNLQACNVLAGTIPAREDCNDFNATISKLFVFALMWSVGALLELEDR